MLEDRSTPAAVPTTTLTVPPNPFLGENLTFTVRFDNTSPSDVGFGPYVDLYLPATGVDGAGSAVDDGITFLNATYLGAPVTATVLTLTSTGVAHPFARDSSGSAVIIMPPAGFQAGDQLVVLQVPFGSFTSNQPPADITVTTAVSNLADVNAPLPIQARGGFRFGGDALNNPTVDPTIVGNAATATVTPTIMKLTKTYIGPEDETTTGPNFPREYQVSVDIANGQTISNLSLTDLLPPELQFLAVTSTSHSTVDVSIPSTSTPGGNLTLLFPSVTGTAGAVDAQMTFSFFVPRVTSSVSPDIINPATGDDVTVSDDAKANGTWDPIDGRDPVSNLTSDLTTQDHILTVKSIATQKTMAITNDVGPAGLSPGDTIEYTVDFRVSDYFAFQNITVRDLFSDGQNYVANSATLAISDGHSGNTSGAFSGSNANLTVNFLGGSDLLRFNVSQELIDRGFSGSLVGGAIPNGGLGNSPFPPDSALPFGPTTGRITFRTVVQDRYEIDFPSGDPALNQGDPVTNANVAISGDLLNTSDLSPNGNSETDSSSAGDSAPRGSFTKSIYAINGVVGTFPSGSEVSPGDTVTYRLTYTLPTGDVENLIFRDFLPLPIFDVDATGAVNGFDNVISAAAPATGRAKFGPSDTFRTLSGIVPTVTLDSTANSVSFNYGTYDDPTNSTTVVDILFTVTVSNDPFADALLLSNGAQVESNNTILESITEEAIGQVTLREPVLNIRKGVVATENIDGIFAPTVTGPVTFNAPGTSGARFTGTVTSAGILATPIDSNLSNVDAGDLVTYAITVENTGGDPDGAFDLFIRDTLPGGVAIPNLGAQGYNLRVTDGAGNVLAYTVVGQGLFDPAGGIQLVDSPGQGAIGPEATDGSNIVIVTFDLRITNVNVLQTITDTARIARFSSSESGPNYVSDPIQDDATVKIGREDLLTKRLVGTEIVDTFNSNTEAVIGELVTYEVTLEVPEGTMLNTVLTDTLDPQLAFVRVVSVVSSADVSFDGNTPLTVTNAGRNLRVSYGNVINANRDNSVTETIVVTYEAVVLNVSSAQGGTNVNNRVTLTFVGLDNPREASAANVLIIEPKALADKSAIVAGNGESGDAGDPVQYTINLTNPEQANTSTANAYDLTFSDPLPFQAGNGTLILNPTFTVVDTAGNVTAAQFQLVGSNAAGWTLQTIPGVTFDMAVSNSRTITITISGLLPAYVSPGQTINNIATARWTSLDGDISIPRSSFNGNSTERTGAGGINDYIVNDNAIVQIRNAGLSKSIVSTSETATTDPNRLVVGEIARFRLQVAIPESQTNLLRIQDLIPDGLQFLNDQTARIAFVSNGGDLLESTTIPDLGDLHFVGNETNVANITPLANVPLSAILGGPFTNGTDVTFDLGDFSNGGTSDADREFIVIEFNAVVTNVVTNQADTTLVNTAQVLINGSVNTTGSTQISVSEPDIPFLDKVMITPTPGGVQGFDAGDLLT